MQRNFPPPLIEPNFTERWPVYLQIGCVMKQPKNLARTNFPANKLFSRVRCRKQTFIFTRDFGCARRASASALCQASTNRPALCTLRRKVTRSRIYCVRRLNKPTPEKRFAWISLTLSKGKVGRLPLQLAFARLGKQKQQLQSQR